jgi:hypothetical protein
LPQDKSLTTLRNSKGKVELPQAGEPFPSTLNLRTKSRMNPAYEHIYSTHQRAYQALAAFVVYLLAESVNQLADRF